MKDRINIVVALVCGLVFPMMEVIFRAVAHGLAGYKYAAMMGYTSLHMIWIGAISVWLMGQVSEGTPRKNFAWFRKVIKAALIFIGVEFFSGLILNVWLKLGVWDYSDLWGNVMGQVAPRFALYWLAVAPFGLWLDAAVKKSIERGVPNLLSYYRDVFFWWK